MNDLPNPLDEAVVRHVQGVLSRSGQAVQNLTVAGHRSTLGNKIVVLNGGVAGQFVLKRIPMAIHNWWRDLTDSPDVESVLWAAGVTKELPLPLRSVHLDVSAKESLGEWWVLMRHVENGGLQDSRPIRSLIEGLAALHAKFWQSEDICKLRLCLPEGIMESTTLPLVALFSTKSVPAWVRDMQELPDFDLQAHWLDLLPYSRQMFYVELWENRGDWLPRLWGNSCTLAHGDVHDGNFLQQGDGSLAVIDWSFANYAPGCCDIAHMEFLMLWCDPKREESVPEPAAGWRRSYERSLGRFLGATPSPLPWELAWLATFFRHAARVGSYSASITDPAEKDDTIRFLQRRMFREAERIAAKL